MDLLRTFSKPFPHKETQSNGPLIPRFFRPLLCWWKNRGIDGPLLCVKNHGILYEYLTLEVISSQAIPGLFTPGIVTSTRCGREGDPARSFRHFFPGCPGFTWQGLRYNGLYSCVLRP